MATGSTCVLRPRTEACASPGDGLRAICLNRNLWVSGTPEHGLVRTVVLKLEQATTKRTVKTLIAGPAPQSFDSVALN